jgi:hypothetical protein
VRTLEYLLAVHGYSLSPEWFLFLEILAGGAVLTLCLRQARRTNDPRQRLTHLLILFALWVALFGPATESCSYVILAPALAWSILEAFHRPSGGLARTWLLVSHVMMGPLVSDLFGPVVRNFANQQGSQPLGALMFLLYCLIPHRPSAARGVGLRPLRQPSAA